MNVILSMLDDFFLGWTSNVQGRIGHYLRYSRYKKRLAFLGQRVIIDQGVSIVSPEMVRIGSNTWIDKYTTILGSGGVTIGDYVHIAQYCLLQGVGHLEIREYASVAANCMIITGTENFFDRRHVNPMIPKKYRCEVIKKKVVIEKDAVLGLGCIVLPGVTIGEGAVVGSHSLVTKDIPAWKIAYGIPAKPIKDRPKIEMVFNE